MFMTWHCTCNYPEIRYFFICLPICHVPQPDLATIPLVFHSSVLITCLLKTFSTIQWSAKIWIHRWSWFFFLYILLPITFRREVSQSRWRKGKAKCQQRLTKRKLYPLPYPQVKEDHSGWEIGQECYLEVQFQCRNHEWPGVGQEP